LTYPNKPLGWRGNLEIEFAQVNKYAAFCDLIGRLRKKNVTILFEQLQL